MKKIFFLLAILMFGSGFARAQKSVLDKISFQLSEYSKNLASEIIYIQTDKDIYNPGDIIWFNASVFNKNTQDLCDTCYEITLKVFDNTGTLITADKFKLENGKSFGDIMLPKLLKRGRYYIAAHTPLQSTNDKVFTKLIFIDEHYSGDVIARILNTEKIYPANNKISVGINISSLNNDPVSKFKLSYNIFFGEEIIGKGRVRTESNGNAMVSIKTPENVGSVPLRVVFYDNKRTWEKTALIKTENDIIRVNFIAEGGSLINGINQTVGFIAKDIYGNYIPLSGNIIDDNNSVIAKCQTFINGFGLFSLESKENENYKFVVTGKYGKGQIFDIPKSEKNGVTVSVLKTDDQYIYANILCKKGNEQKIALTATSECDLLWAGEIVVSGPSGIKIPCGNFPSGLILLSAFNQNTEVLGERLVYFDKTENLNFNINYELFANNINISLSTTNEKDALVNSKASVSVVSIHNQKEYTANLKNELSFNSVLANEIPDNNDLFTKTRASAKALDYLLITNSLADFSWERIINLNPSDLSQYSNSRPGLSGKVTGKYKLGVPGAKINILNPKTMLVYSQTTNSQGEFFFPSLSFGDINDFNMTATDSKGQKDYNIVVYKTFDEKLSSEIRKIDLRNATKNVSRENLTEFLKLNSDLVTNPPSKSDLAPKQKYEPAYKSLLKSSVSLLEVIKTIKSFRVSEDKIIFPGMLNSIYSQQGAEIYIDKQKLGTSASVLENYNPSDIEEINIYTNAVDIQRFTSFASGGVIEIFTKNQNIAETPTKQITETDEFRIPGDFHIYKNSSSENNGSLNSTLYWNPEILLNDSSTVNLTIPLPELKSDYVITVEGTDEEGRRGAARQIIKINF